jgi:hypothetical protein
MEEIMKSRFLRRVSEMQRGGWSTRLLLVVCFVCGLFAASASAAPSVYVVTLTQQFGIVDLANGEFTPIGSPTPDGLSNLIWLTNGSLLSLATTPGHAGFLAKINPATGKETPLRPILYGGKPLGLNAFSLASARGKVYVTDFSNNLYSVNPANGAAVRVGENGGTTGLRPDPNIPLTFNRDGTFNLCDEGLYGFGGELYATFDSYAIHPKARTIARQYLAPYLWRIDPLTGAATFIANTDLQLSAIVEADGKLYAFKAVLDGFDFHLHLPIGHAQLVTLDVKTGKTSKIADLDSSVGPVFGAAPVPND